MSELDANSSQIIVENDFMPDTPLSDIKQDRLGWDRLTKEIVEAIKLNKHESGFTIGIKGKWGPSVPI